jgi:hypothetical protein
MVLYYICKKFFSIFNTIYASEIHQGKKKLKLIFKWDIYIIQKLIKIRKYKLILSFIELEQLVKELPYYFIILSQKIFKNSQKK